MPHFGAIEEFKRLADECYKLVNCKYFLNAPIVRDVFCTESCTSCTEWLRVMFVTK